VGATLVALAGCTTGANPGVLSAPTSSVAQAYYSGLSGECPTLQSAEAKRYSGIGKGRLVPIPQQVEAYEWINCSWRPPTGAPWVTVLVRIYWDGFAPTQTGLGNAEAAVTQSLTDNANRAEAELSGGIRTIERTTDSGRASMLADGAANSVSQSTAIGNAVVTVMLFETKNPGADIGARADELAAKLAPASDAITSEIAGQLVAKK
jgi:hypothetical protein